MKVDRVCPRCRRRRYQWIRGWHARAKCGIIQRVTIECADCGHQWAGHFNHDRDLNARDWRRLGVPHTGHERKIAKALGVTPSGLDVIIRLHRGACITGGMVGEKLEKQGHVTPWACTAQGFEPRRLTESGERIYRQARALGY